MSKLIGQITWEDAMDWAICPFCEGSQGKPDCDVCIGTNRDAMPWSELFSKGRTHVWGTPWHAGGQK